MYCSEEKVKVSGVIHKKIFDAGFGGRTIEILFGYFDSRTLFRLIPCGRKSVFVSI